MLTGHQFKNKNVDKKKNLNNSRPQIETAQNVQKRVAALLFKKLRYLRAEVKHFKI